MRFLLLIFSLYLLSATSLLAADWTGFKGCGLYKVRGVGRTIKNALVIVVNEKTKSEIIFSLPINNEPTLAPYVDRPLEATVQINKPMNGSKGFGVVQSIKSRLPDPLNPVDTGMSLMTKSECKK